MFNLMPQTQSSRLSLIAIVFLSLTSLTLSGCDLASNYLKTDREGGNQFQDYRDAFASRVGDNEEPAKETTSANIPALQPYISMPSNDVNTMPLVSISLNQNVPLRDALFELAQQADYDIELDPRISGAVIFTARERPLDQVIERLSEIAGLRYKFEDNTLRVELDTPYNKLYKLDYLSYVRKSSSGINNNIAVVSGEGADSGSTFEASAENEANFWGELEVNLEQIITGVTTGALRTSSSPQLQVIDQNPEVASLDSGQTGGVTDQTADATLRVESLPLGGSAGAAKEDVPEVDGSFTINKQAGIINVFATERSHRLVNEYLEVLRKSVTSQVLIEAKILEVSLNDEFVTGIDWGGLNFLGGELVTDFLSNGTTRGVSSLVPGISTGLGGTSIATGQNFVIGYNGNDVQALIEAISGFGTVRALASPRLTVLNNQAAVLSVATNQVFFEVDVDRTEGTDGAGDTIDVDSDIRSIPEGVLINVIPSIDLEKRTVSMAVRPTITRVVSQVADPAVEFAAGATGIQNLVPELNVQEIDSVIQVRSGQPVVMGGLLQDQVVSTESGVPIVSEAPLIGSLFKDRDDLIQKTELVIFLRATILDGPGQSVHAVDKDFYRRFSSDRRPLKF